MSLPSERTRRFNVPASRLRSCGPASPHLPAGESPHAGRPCVRARSRRCVETGPDRCFLQLNWTEHGVVGFTFTSSRLRCHGKSLPLAHFYHGSVGYLLRTPLVHANPPMHLFTFCTRSFHPINRHPARYCVSVVGLTICRTSEVPIGFRTNTGKCNGGLDHCRP